LLAVLEPSVSIQEEAVLEKYSSEEKDKVVTSNDKKQDSY
jgi:hypothetical protein